jgi:urease accessory protein
VFAEIFAASPLRVLTPRNHGHAAWAFLSSFGGGLVDGDRLEIELRAGPRASALLGTQASTKVYRSPRGCAQSLAIHAAEESLVAILPDPVVCFSGARYEQTVHVTLAESASIALLDGYTSGRRARGERWQFDALRSRTTVLRGNRPVLIDAIDLDPAHGPLQDRMGRFDVVLTFAVFGPRLGAVREAMLAQRPGPSPGDPAVVSASPLGSDGAILRVAAVHVEAASLALRPSFEKMTSVLGDDPFARKW